MKIEIWSDIACPYCYIGKRRLENALQKFPYSEEVDIIWHSYELSPDLPATPSDKSIFEHIASQHNISVEEQKMNMQKIATLAKSVGLDFNFDTVVVANTSRALRLVKLAHQHKLANEAEEALFEAYFTLGKDISDTQVLLNIGEKIGLLSNEIQNMLNSDQYESEVKEDICYSEEELDLQYIPFYRIDEKFVIQGSLTEEEYSDILERAYNAAKENNTSSDTINPMNGKACSIDGTCEI